MKIRTTIVLATGSLLAATALLAGCSSDSTPSSSTNSASPTRAAESSAAANKESAASGANVDATCKELKKLVNNEKVQALIAGETDGSLASILSIGGELAPMLGDFMSDLPKDAPAAVTDPLMKVGGLLATAVTSGGLTDDELEQLESSTNTVLTWAKDNCGVNVGGGGTE